MTVMATGITVGCMLIAYPVIEKRFSHKDYQSAESRKPLNRAALSIIMQHPVSGVGLNNFAEVFHQEDSSGFARIFRAVNASGQVKHYRQVVHNLYLLVWAELGVFGLLAFLGQFIVAIATLCWKRCKDRSTQALRIGVCAGLTAQLLHGLFDPGFKTSFSVSLLVYCLLGMLAAANQTPRPPSREVERQ